MQKVRVVLREEVFIQGLPEYCRDILINENTFPNPKKIREVQMMDRCSDSRKKNAMRYKLRFTPDDIVLWRESGNWISLPRGFLGEALKIMDHCGIQAEIVDQTIAPPWSDIVDISTSGELFDYQKDSLAGLLSNTVGTMEAPTGSGKSNVILSIIPLVMTPTMIIVHTKELLKQTAERCKSWLGYEPGIIGSGKSKPKDITIGMIQSLSKKDLKEEGYLSRFGCIIADECHHVPAETWAGVIRKFPAKYKYGFTATAWRKDKMEMLIWRVISPITSKVSKSEVKDAGRIVIPEIIPVPTKFWYDIADTSDWIKMISDMVENEERNWLIRDTVVRELNSRPDSKGLILSDRIDHTEILGRMLDGFNPVILNGNLKSKERRDNMAQVKEGTRLTIATTHLLGEGVDVPSWDLLFLVTPVVGGPRTVQIMGRVARPAPGKERAILYDFVDEKIGMLKTAFYARNRLYKKRD
jgi:superfamily II DNA or RNA helicase